MEASRTASGSCVQPLALPPELTIYTVGKLHPQWCRWLDDGAVAKLGMPRSVDAAAVESVDGAGLQVLVALSHAAAASGCLVQLCAPSAALQSACATLGLQGWLVERTAAAESPR